MESFAANLSNQPCHHARRRRYRYEEPSTLISSRHAKPYENAVRRAFDIDQIDFNVFVTVRFERTNFWGCDLFEVVKRLRRNEKKWFHRRGLPFIEFSVREPSETYGEHWHQLIACPEERRGEFHGYVQKIIKCPRRRNRALHFKRPGRSARCSGCGGLFDAKHFARRYFLKNATDAVRRRNGVTDCGYERSYGEISGPRLFYSLPPRTTSAAQFRTVAAAASIEFA